MCRMFAYLGSSPRKVEELLDCLKKSAEKDVYLNNSSHPDGWGFVLLTKDKIFHYRSANPIFNEEFPINLKSEEMMLIVHARQATDKSLVGSQFSHPYVESNEKAIYYFAHNGSVDKEALSKILNINSVRMVDSELALKYIINGDIFGNIHSLKKFTKSSLNMFLLEIERNGNASLYYMNYVNRNYLQSKNISDIYYKMYIDNENGIAVYSSTINYYCNNKGKEVNEGIIEKIGEMKIKLGYNK